MSMATDSRLRTILYVGMFLFLSLSVTAFDERQSQHRFYFGTQNLIHTNYGIPSGEQWLINTNAGETEFYLFQDEGRLGPVQDLSEIEEVKYPTFATILGYDVGQNIPYDRPILDLALSEYTHRSLGLNVSPFFYTSGLNVYRLADRQCHPLFEDLDNDGTIEMISLSSNNVFRIYNYNPDTVDMEFQAQKSASRSSFASCPAIGRNGTQKMIVFTLFDDFGWEIFNYSDGTIQSLNYSTGRNNACGDFSNIVCGTEQAGNNASYMCMSTSYDTSNCNGVNPSTSPSYTHMIYLNNFSLISQSSTSGGRHRTHAGRRRNATTFEFAQVRHIHSSNLVGFRLFDGSMDLTNICFSTVDSGNSHLGMSTIGALHLSDANEGVYSFMTFDLDGTGTFADVVQLYQVGDECNTISKITMEESTFFYTDLFDASIFCNEAVGITPAIGTISMSQNIDSDEQELFFHCVGELTGEYKTIWLGDIIANISTLGGVGNQNQLLRTVWTTQYLTTDGSDTSLYVFTSKGIFRLSPDYVSRNVNPGGTDYDYLYGFSSGIEGNRVFDPRLLNGTLQLNGTMMPINIDGDGILDLMVMGESGIVDFYISAQPTNPPEIEKMELTPTPLCFNRTFDYNVWVSDQEQDTATVQIACGEDNFLSNSSTTPTSDFPVKRTLNFCNYNDPDNIGEFVTEQFFVKDDTTEFREFHRRNVLISNDTSICNEPTVQVDTEANENIDAAISDASQSELDVITGYTDLLDSVCNSQGEKCRAVIHLLLSALLAFIMVATIGGNLAIAGSALPATGLIGIFFGLLILLTGIGSFLGINSFAWVLLELIPFLFFIVLELSQKVTGGR